MAECVGYSEINKYAQAIYRYHYPEHKGYGDATGINTDDLPNFDLLVGGFPCQSFSIAGKRGGFSDSRGTLFFEIARIAGDKQPSVMLLENVKGIISHDNGDTLRHILFTLQKLGYFVNFEIINSKDYGVPQNRERIFFTCRNLKNLADVGQNQKITICEQIIQEWLFQCLLNNLDVVSELQEHVSKDSVVAYLVLDAMVNGLNPNLSWLRETLIRPYQKYRKNYQLNLFQEFTIKQENWEELKKELVGIMIAMGENESGLMVKVWQSIELFMNNLSEENLKEPNTSTTLTAIRGIIELRTYTYSLMLQTIVSAVTVLRNLQPNLWKEILSSLIVIRENTKYARINDCPQKGTIKTESNCLYNAENLMSIQERFIIGHLRERSGPEVFPIQQSNSWDSQAVSRDTFIRGRNKNTSGCLDTRGVNAFNRSDLDKLIYTYGKHYSVRRLTPLEAERLQAFPDGYTKYGLFDDGIKEISDTQRYNCLGNAVTTSVIRAIMERLSLFI